MTIAEQAFTELYPEKDMDKFSLVVKYSGKFSGYNANVKYKKGSKTTVEFNLSRKWKEISPEIQIGLMQYLLEKIYREKKKTTNMDLYDIFLKNIHVAVPKEESHPELEKSFDRVNEKYFFGMIDKPNIEWGNESFSKLGSYSYGEDKITISTIFRNIEDEDKVFLDYIMYHELLHKKHKFKNSGLKSYHHTKDFKISEKKFQAHGDIEKELTSFIRKKKKAKVFKEKGFLERLFI